MNACVICGYESEPGNECAMCALSELRTELTELRRVRDVVREWGVAVDACDVAFAAYQQRENADTEAVYDDAWERACAAKDAVREIADQLANREGVVDLAKLIALLQNRVPPPGETGVQRISFAYGNAKLSNPDVTREMAEQAVCADYEKQIAALLARATAAEKERDRFREMLENDTWRVRAESAEKERDELRAAMNTEREREHGAVAKGEKP